MQLVRIAYKTESDENLMRAMARGDKRAFDEIYTRYADSLKRYFKRMLWQDELKAEDFVHDIFAKLIRKPDYFDVSRSFKTWVFSVACNMCKNEYKKLISVEKNVQGKKNNLTSFFKDVSYSKNPMFYRK